MVGPLQKHLALEEETLFPACRELERSGVVPGVLDEDLLATHEEDHLGVGTALREMRGLGDDYRPEHGLCGTHRNLLHSLHQLELDLHQHVHEENNVLFPRVRNLIAEALRPVGA